MCVSGTALASDHNSDSQRDAAWEEEASCDKASILNARQVDGWNFSCYMSHEMDILKFFKASVC